MKYLKSIFANKTAGFYMSVALMLLALTTGVVHAICYANFQNQGATAISWPSVGLCIAIFVIGLVLIFTKQAKYLPYLALALAIPALCCFIYYSYFYVTVMITGIDDTINAMYVINALLFISLFIYAFVVIYFNVGDKKPTNKEANK